MNTNTPKIIIYMSCYNHEKYVQEAMDSIIQQTYTRWELYVVNDASTDRTGEILATYRDERIHYYDFKENTAFIGAANFLQNLVADIDAEYITTFSSDDKWEPDKLQKQIEVLIAHPEYKCCFTWDKVIFDAEDKTYETRVNYSHIKNRNRYDWVKFYVEDGNCMNACSALMNKKVFYELGRMNENYRQTGDWRLWLKLALKYPFFVLEEEKTYYRRHEANLSRVNHETLGRYANEVYWTFLEIFRTIDAETFLRIFYSKLPYHQFYSTEEFLAAKFIVLLNEHTRIYEQVAIGIYFENCENQAFLDALERKYYYKPGNFIFLCGNGGLLYYSLDRIPESQCVPMEKAEFSPAFILVYALTDDEVKPDTLQDYTYSTMVDLLGYCSEGALQDEQFEKIYLKILAIRDSRINIQMTKKIVFFVGEDSAFDIAAELAEVIQDENNKCYYSVIPKAGRMFDLHDEINESPDFDIPNAQYIKLYNEKEHCLKFLDEENIAADIIYYIDCVSDEYQCADMMAGYPLNVKNICIVNVAQYYDMSEKGSSILKLFDEIYTYG